MPWLDSTRTASAAAAGPTRVGLREDLRRKVLALREDGPVVIDMSNPTACAAAQTAAMTSVVMTPLRQREPSAPGSEPSPWQSGRLLARTRDNAPDILEKRFGKANGVKR